MDRRKWLESTGYLTGSMAFGVATEESDEDWLVLPGRPESEFNGLRESPTGSMERDVQGVEFVCYRDGKLNIIRALTQSFADRWRIAHDICMRLKPTKKSHRKLIFRMALYGENTANEKNLQEA